MAGSLSSARCGGFDSGVVSSPRIMSGEVGSEGKDTPSESTGRRYSSPSTNALRRRLRLG